jgi:hypothetical protein
MIARWAQVKRLSQEQVKKLHKIENDAHDSGVAEGKGCGWPYARAMAAGISYLADVNAELGPFWPRGITESDRQTQNEAFARHVYKFWAPVWAALEKGEIGEELQAIQRVDISVLADAGYEYPVYFYGSKFKTPIDDKKARAAGEK